MASTTAAICAPPTAHPQRSSIFNVIVSYTVPRRLCVTFCSALQESSKRLSYVHQLKGRRDHTEILKPVCAVGSGLETSMTDSKGGILTLKTVEIAVESEDSDKIKLRVDLTGEETLKAFNVVLSNLARSTPPIPGFRLQKGGKTSKVPRNLFLDIIGKDRVMKFVIQEIVTSAAARYVEEKNLTIKENKIKTTQTEDELKQTFLPGNAFGFNVELELETEEVTETSTAEAQS